MTPSLDYLSEPTKAVGSSSPAVPAASELPAWMAQQLGQLPATSMPDQQISQIFSGVATLGDLLALTERDETLLEQWQASSSRIQRCLSLAPIPLPVVPLGF